MKTKHEAADWTRSWLWPDHAIGKRESRRLREEHNKLSNSHAELLEALSALLRQRRSRTPLIETCDMTDAKIQAYERAEAAIAKAEGR